MSDISILEAQLCLEILFYFLLFQSVLDKIRKIIIKKLIEDGSTRLKECLTHSTDDGQEEKVKSNKFFWCFIHSL
ncbi:hypothetical protein MA16_Dca007311 [Dendrobium catenatum]|uniref:Uncharacterized protein n=1 Tax=Dendrobium catenatum TaxID=906689 RepID=A0A2I0W6M5_9ASPA|nr:hypothetical protein MA16_Dca007311 [Dendrobium catenatum]